MHGRVLDAASGAPLAGARVWIEARERQEHGTLEVWEGGTTLTGADGSYALSLPTLDDFRALVYGEDGGALLLTEEWSPVPGLDAERRDFALP